MTRHSLWLRWSLSRQESWRLLKNRNSRSSLNWREKASSVWKRGSRISLMRMSRTVSRAVRAIRIRIIIRMMRRISWWLRSGKERMLSRLADLTLSMLIKSTKSWNTVVRSAEPTKINVSSTSAQPLNITRSVPPNQASSQNLAFRSSQPRNFSLVNSSKIPNPIII